MNQTAKTRQDSPLSTLATDRRGTRRRNPKSSKHGLLLLASLAPIFATTASPFLTLFFLRSANLTSAEAIPLASLASVAFAVAIVKRRSVSLKGVLLLLTISWSLSLLAGLLTISSFRQAFFLFQSLALLLTLVGSFFMAGTEVRDGSSEFQDEVLARRIAITCILGSLLGSVAAFTGGLATAVAVIPSFRSYYAILPAICAGIGFSGRFSARLRGIALISVAASLPTLWSRSGLLAVAVVIAIQAISASKTLKGMLVSVALGIGGLVALLQSGSLALTRNAELGADDNFLSGRSRFFEGSFEVIYSNPLFGDSFELVSSRNFNTQSGSTSVSKPFTAHNQILEWAVHLGLPTTALLILLVVGAYRRIRFLNPHLQSIVQATLVSTAVLSLSHVPFSVLFPGVALMAMCGMLYAKASVPSFEQTIEVHARAKSPTHRHSA